MLLPSITYKQTMNGRCQGLLTFIRNYLLLLVRIRCFQTVFTSTRLCVLKNDKQLITFFQSLLTSYYHKHIGRQSVEEIGANYIQPTVLLYKVYVRTPIMNL